MRNFWFLFLLLTILPACKQDPFNGGKPYSIGEYGEIFVVGEEEFLTPDMRQKLTRVLGAEQPLYGGSEPYFKLVFLTPGLLKATMFYEGTMLVLCQPSAKSELLAKMPAPIDSMILAHRGQNGYTVIQRDVWAKPQGVCVVSLANRDSLESFLDQNGTRLLQQLISMEREEATAKTTIAPDMKISKDVFEKMQVRIKAPIRFHIVTLGNPKPDEGFVWLREDGEKADLNLVVHYEPYIDTSQFSLSYMISRRDSLVREFIQGGPKGSYMSTDNQFPYFLTNTSFQGQFAREYYGYWTLVNGFMGGPYYSVTTLDTKRNRVVTLEGFAYAPDQNKTKYIRELQGILFGIQFD